MKDYKNKNDLGKVNKKNLKWTKEAIFCYDRNCRCFDCRNRYIMESSKCQLKAAVLELVKKLGKPKN